MNIDKAHKAIREAQRFINRADEYINAECNKTHSYQTNPKESGALRRSSLDLTRALAELRSPK